jgi:hypothetical protein
MSGAPSSVGLIDTTRSPHAKLHGIGFADVAWTGGFWGDISRRCVNVMVPSMGKLMQETERFRFIGNFLVAAGVEEGRSRGPRWNDGDFYKWLEGACVAYSITRDPAVDAQIDSLIAIVARAQRDDGYIHTNIQIRQRAGETVAEFDNPMDFEMYNMGHLMTAACVHHRVTGRCNLLDLALKAASFLQRVFANPTPQQARHGICPSHLMGLVELYRTTGDAVHLDLAKKLLAMRDLVQNGDDDNQDRVPLRQHKVAHGHAVRATYLYAGTADIVAETGDAELLSMLQTVWADLVNRKLYITGGCGALFDGASPDGSEAQLTITRVHQSFGRDYQLPHSTAHNETCAAIGSLMWSWRMFLLTGEARYADLVEHTLYNSVLTGIGLDGVSFTYTNTLRKLEPMPVPLRWGHDRKTTIGCFCCPPNVVRTLAESAQYAYALGEREVFVVLYGQNRLDATLKNGTHVKLRQETQYPWDGRVTISVEQCDGPTAIKLRVPAWSRSTSIRVNGAAVEVAGDVVTIDRAWRAGDTIEIDFDMTARLVESNPYVEETRQQVAVQRGPVVYCLESADLPEGVRVLDVGLPGTSQPEVDRIDPQFGVVLKTPAVRRKDSAKLDSPLYRAIEMPSVERTSATLIPYFAWGNRGPGEMTVWLPLYL